MNELIKIEQRDGKQLVSARELHIGLNSKQDFSTWIKNRIKKYEFEDGVDFITAPQTYGTANGGFSTRIEYGLTVDTAKELCMIENNEEGRKFRKYFIQCERQLLQVNEKDKLLVGLFSSDPMVVAQSHKALVELETKPLVEQITQKQTVIDSVIRDNSLFAVSDVGRMLKPYCSDMGANKIFEYLRSKFILFDEPNTARHNTPYSKYTKAFNVKVIDKNDRTYYKAYFNGRGLKWFMTKLVKENLITPQQKQEAEKQFEGDSHE